MACILSAPSTDNGKTTLALLISCWAIKKGLKLQTFKVGPDYLDQQQLSSIGHPICRNLDIFLSGEDWIEKTFYKYSNKYDLSLIEGAMGLFDGLGSTDHSSTAHIARVLNIPIIFIVNATGKVASLLPLLNGFRDFDKRISIKGIIFNNVNSERHKKLISEVFKNVNIEILGFLPSNPKISLKKGNLGIISPLESKGSVNIDYFANFAEKHLNLKLLIKFLQPENKSSFFSYERLQKINKFVPIAIAEDNIFHFQYPETKEFLEDNGISLIPWNIFNDEEIPNGVSSLIIPGGFPEKFAHHISQSKRSLDSLRRFKNKGFIYAECGGMMILGEYIEDTAGNRHKMAGILPFSSKKGKLKLGYRYLKGEKNSLLLDEQHLAKGHEFHYWEIENSNSESFPRRDKTLAKYASPWKVKSWTTKYKKEGWASNNLHASWVHLHLPSSDAGVNFLKILKEFSR